jgi:hypothetical protein
MSSTTWQLPPDSTGDLVDVRTVSGSGRQVVCVGDDVDEYRQDVGFFGTAAISGPINLRDNTEAANYAYVSDAGRLRVGADSLLFFDGVDGSNLNYNLWTSAVTTMTIVQASNFVTLNNGNITTINTAAQITSQKHMPYLGHFPILVQFRAKTPVNPQANARMELGLGTASGTSAPTDGVFFRWHSDGSFYGVVNNGGTETTTAITAPSINTVHTFEITVFPRRVVFRIDNGSPVSLNLPAASGSAWGTTKQPAFARVYTLGTAPSSAPRLDIAECVVVAAELTGSKPWSEQVTIAREQGSYDKPVFSTDWGGTANHANSTPPTSASLSNTAASYTTLGGRWQFAALATNGTDWALFGYQIPAGVQLVVTGIAITAQSIGAACGTQGYMLDWAIGVNSSAVSLATAESPPTTWGPRRYPIGTMSIPNAAPRGSSFPAIDRVFPSPIVCHSGRFFHIILTQADGQATASQIIRGDVMVNGYFE